ncbi:hypothetical protein [Streptomyces sp. NBRC 109706]|uniref:hypothetical protein n=1 Tax=Streptomyces sp. NBRC 109706 TaxID=1550035 RepID=UPI000782F7AD|nr:hypothetical protein [Streptomyces sp. NBRC 109706]
MSVTTFQAGPGAVELDGPVLVERRRAGEAFPRVPVIEGVELPRELVAVALFEGMPQGRVENWDDPELCGMLVRAVRRVGVDGLSARLPEFAALPVGGEGEVRRAAAAWSFAYRLCVLFWYHQAWSERLGRGEIAAALYASDLPINAVASSPARELAGYLSEGIARLGAGRVVEFGGQIEARYLRERPERELSAEVRAAMPDKRRRWACWNAAVNFPGGMCPLLAAFPQYGMGDVCEVVVAEDYAVGVVPPPNPGNALLDVSVGPVRGGC